ncbi:hypothetical protein WQE_04932 [Paraburkholderia hospita]|uniref:Lipid A 3-O-deacylase (PagL) n=1 Tax=Paraburkholderia hospita TaxID=169430 RepID=A0ABN0FU75_9BURK|nr:hypothetical protein [Paraburkholderia hospita]EIN02305.1 hypothetical protein WQE_04932 [Paraburkholderia hospita]
MGRQSSIPAVHVEIGTIRRTSTTSAHKWLFFAMARLELSAEVIARILDHMRRAVAFTFEPFWTYRNWRFGVEAGPSIFRGTWDATATSLTDTPWWGPAGSVETFHHQPKWERGAVVGFGVSYQLVTVRYNYIFSKTHTYGPDNPPPGWSGAHMVTVGFTF